MRKCLLVCEGPFDELIFSLLKDCFDESILEIKPLCRCCLDTPDLIDNISRLISEILSKEHGYDESDFDEICFLVDSDGIYINDDEILECNELNCVEYGIDTIKCPNKRNILARNRLRTKNISDLHSSKKYFVFYNSRNLEHSFDSSNIGKLKDKAKKKFALETLGKYSLDIDSFLIKLNEMNKSKTYNYYKSWDFLKNGNNSLSSCSNICVFICMHYYALKKEFKELFNTFLTEK